MNKINKKKLETLYHEVGLKNNLRDETVKEIVESQFLFAKQTIDNIDLKKIETEEEFDNLKTNFIFRFLGKLHTDYKRVEGRRKQSETFKKINKKKWEKN